MSVSASICPICGNIRENKKCNRCDGNFFARQRRRRRGDKAGKRPERRHIRRSFQEALDGTWKNQRFQVTIQISPESGEYCSKHGKRPPTYHRFKMGKNSHELRTFYKDDLLIEAAISDMGFLILATKDTKMAFAYEFDDMLYRTCPICFTKSPLELEKCRECWWEFESYT